MLIGITGGSGTGKSVVADVFRKKGIEVIDADKEAREAVKKGSIALSEISKAFGKEYIDENGELIRKKLGSLVFANPDKLKQLNKIIGKSISDRINEKIKNSSSKMVVLDAPLLIEYGMDKMCDRVIAVLADKEIRIKRITERDKISEIDAENRINSQKVDNFYIEKADYIVYNNKDMENAERETERIIDILG